MATTYYNTRLNEVDSSGNVKVYYPETVGSLVTIDRSSNSNIPSTVSTLQDLVNSLASSAFTVPTSVTTATYATYLSTTRYIDGVAFNGGSNIHHLATSSTAASTQAKTATLLSGTFSLLNGSMVIVRFTYANTNTSATLNINSTGAYTIYNASKYLWNAGDIVEFIYYSSYWYVVNVTTASSAAFELAIDEVGNYGYKKAGADTVTPFRVGESSDVLLGNWEIQWPSISRTAYTAYAPYFPLSRFRCEVNGTNKARLYNGFFGSTDVYQQTISYKISGATQYQSTAPYGATAVYSPAFGSGYLKATVTTGNLTISYCASGTSTTVHASLNIYSSTNANYVVRDVIFFSIGTDVSKMLVGYDIYNASTGYILNKYLALITTTSGTSISVSSSIAVCPANTSSVTYYSDYTTVPLMDSDDCNQFTLIRSDYSNRRLQYNSLRIVGTSLTLNSGGWKNLTLYYNALHDHVLNQALYKYLGFIAVASASNYNSYQFHYRGNNLANAGTVTTISETSVVAKILNIHGKLSSGEWVLELYSPNGATLNVTSNYDFTYNYITFQGNLSKGAGTSSDYYSLPFLYLAPFEESTQSFHNFSTTYVSNMESCVGYLYITKKICRAIGDARYRIVSLLNSSSNESVGYTAKSVGSTDSLYISFNRLDVINGYLLSVVISVKNSNHTLLRQFYVIIQIIKKSFAFKLDSYLFNVVGVYNSFGLGQMKSTNTSTTNSYSRYSGEHLMNMAGLDGNECGGDFSETTNPGGSASSTNTNVTKVTRDSSLSIVFSNNNFNYSTTRTASFWNFGIKNKGYCYDSSINLKATNAVFLNK